jgi:predicted DNA-binding transcriptional regulator
LHRDKVIGFSLLALGLTVTPIYLLLVLYPAQFLHFFGVPVDASTGLEVRMYAGLVPVVIGLVAALVIGAWVGLSIVTSPSPQSQEQSDKQ